MATCKETNKNEARWLICYSQYTDRIIGTHFEKLYKGIGLSEDGLKSDKLGLTNLGFRD